MIMKKLKEKPNKQKVSSAYRLAGDIQEAIRLGALAAGVTKTEFLERCIMNNAEQVADMADSKRAELRESLRKHLEKLKDNA